MPCERVKKGAKPYYNIPFDAHVFASKNIVLWYKSEVCTNVEIQKGKNPNKLHASHSEALKMQVRNPVLLNSPSDGQ